MPYRDHVNDYYRHQLGELHASHLYKEERSIHSPQGPVISVE